MARPLGPRTLFATDDTYTSGPHNGEPNKLALLSGEKTQGWHPGKRLPAKKLNQLLNEHSAWDDYLADVPLINWHTPIRLDLSAAAPDTTYTREQNGVGNLNQTSDVFWSENHKRWILCGSATAGSFFIFDQGLLEKWAGGGSTPPNYAFGVESGDRICLFSGTNYGTGQAIKYVRLGSNALNGGTVGTLPGAVAGNAHAGKAIRVGALLSGGYDIFVFGGRDGNDKIWSSMDDGASFSEQNVGAATGSAYIVRGVIGNIHTGGTRRIIAVRNESTANGGKNVWYSDGGVGGTWQSITFPVDGIVDIVYDDTSKLYWIAAGEGSKLYVSDDPIGGTLTALIDGTPGSYPKITALAAYGDSVLFTYGIAADRAELYAIPNPDTFPRFIHRVWAGGGTGIADTVLPGSIASNPYGRFALQCPGKMVQYSLHAYGA